LFRPRERRKKRNWGKSLRKMQNGIWIKAAIFRFKILRKQWNDEVNLFLDPFDWSRASNPPKMKERVKN